MENAELLESQLQMLREKYAATGQDLHMYLDSLYRSRYLMYWDYIQLDTLMTLQKPRTDYPDEKIFILYHQITELYFSLILHEQEQMCFGEPTPEFFLMRLERIVRYFKHLEDSFEIMIGGMELEQFRAFRTALAPASGFQTAQYRMIEMYSTALSNLVVYERRKELAEASLEEQYEAIYWNAGGVDTTTGKPTYTAKAFRKKYDEQFLNLCRKVQGRHLLAVYRNRMAESHLAEPIRHKMRQFDAIANINWPLTHFETARHYLQSPEGDAAATGGTNWKQYLNPHNQRVIYFPELWSEEEKAQWGLRRYPIDK